MRINRITGVLILGCIATGCARTAQDRTTNADSVITIDSAAGLRAPESVVHDAVRDRYLVSSMNGGATEKDNNGFISRIRPDGTVDSLMFIAGGRGGVTLHSPKGLTIQADTIWVTDIDAVRGFHAVTGGPVREISLAPLGAIFLNDVATGPDGVLYVTDSGLRFFTDSVTHPGPDRIFLIDAARRPSQLLRGDELARPNGVTWDAAGGRLLIAPLSGTSILAWRPGEARPAAIGSGAGGYDGIEMLDSARFVVSSLDSSSVELFRGDSVTTIIRGLATPADIGLDRRRGRVLIPSFSANTLIIHPLERP